MSTTRTPESSPKVTKKHYLFGYPISHSASPALHNSVFSQVSPERRYDLCDTFDVTQPHLKEMIREDPAFGGASVTMPLKVAICDPSLGIVDGLTPAAQAIGSINTIVVEEDPSKPSGRRFMGTNSDYLGVRNSLLRQLAISAGLSESAYTSPVSRRPSAFPPHTYASFIIGGGGTTRSSIYALSALNLSPIYLINRDPEETRTLVNAFPQVDLQPLHSVEAWEKARGSPDARPIPIAVGCIPAVEPATDGEKLVYTLAHKFLDESFVARGPTPLPGTEFTWIASPEKRAFLEMAYKPRVTPMLNRAEEAGWVPVSGIQAMIEQGFAQGRMWLVGQASASAASWTGEGAPIPESVQNITRDLIEHMGDVVVTKKEEWGVRPDDAGSQKL